MKFDVPVDENGFPTIRIGNWTKTWPIELGLYLTCGNWITYNDPHKRLQLVRVVQGVDSDKLMYSTDGVFLDPHEWSGTWSKLEFEEL